VRLCPLTFEPIFKPKLWGGRRLEALLDKRLPPEQTIGESWELADLESDQSVVATGPARGYRLGRLVAEWGPALLGEGHLSEGRFPLLVKYLDATQDLSVQVHPNEAVARRLGGAVRPKNEAWYVIEAAPDGCIYRGLVPGVDRAAFERAIGEGTATDLLKRIPVRPGECYYLPSGTVHALGAGVVVAEVQTPSDVTYRVFDWNRVDPGTGRVRELQIGLALECIDFEIQAIRGEERSHVASVWTTVTRLVTCGSFIIERVRLTEGLDQPIPYGQLVIWMVLEGRGAVAYGNGRDKLDFGRGDTVLLPAGLDEARLITHSDCVWLELTVPTRTDGRRV
jgi:mannose-6-phosphate isomerase